jgi:hypothetical protein
MIDLEKGSGGWSLLVQAFQTSSMLFQRAKEDDIKNLEESSHVRGKCDDWHSDTSENRDKPIRHVR